MAILIILKGSQKGQRFKLTKVVNHIGRSIKNDVCLPNIPNISRNHCLIRKTAYGYEIEDLGSRNGTYVNGFPVKKSLLKDGDEITIGSVVLLFRDSSEEQAEIQAESSQEGPTTLTEDIDTETVDKLIKNYRETQDVDVFEGTVGHDSINAADLSAIERNAKKLKLIYDVGKELISIKPLNEFLEIVMDQVFEVVQPERGFIMLLDDKTGELKPMITRHVGGKFKEGEHQLQMSRTIARKVISDKVAILTMNAQRDDRFSDGKSIQMMGLRSVMCVPLIVKEKVLGLINVDTRLADRAFSSDELALLQALANYAAIGIEQARLNEKIRHEIEARSRLQRYHSPAVLDRILKQDETTEPAQTRRITVLFADIVGFTSMTEKMESRQVAEILNEYYTEMTECIFKYHGTLDKFIGDSVMALFGAPIAIKNSEERAIKCGLLMQNRLERLNKEKPADRQLLMRVGINTGSAVVGDFGSPKRMEYTALGNTVNTAHRIEHTIAQPGDVVVGEETYLATKKLFDFEKLATVEVKGLTEPISVYRVIKPRANI